MTTARLLSGLLAAAGLTVSLSIAAADSPAPEARQYTFAWMFRDDSAMRPRGGITTGPAVQLDDSPNAAWLALQETGLSDRERDRRAILAMAGGYRTSFDFIETVGFVADYQPTEPYQSWATEYVYVVADNPAFVSLQHIIVMFFETPDGEVSGPMVVKHWRQDWQYQDKELHVYAGHNSWQRITLTDDEVRGTWSQAVFQVDDSPRYQAIGRWQHRGNYSSWQSENTWRPLPRREFSVRDDYHVLSGTNRHTITPTGWVHEEDNLKLVLDSDGRPRESDPYLAREAGLNRYERIVGHDFSAGDRYWQATGPFWADVRQGWNETFARRERVTLRKSVDQQLLFEAMFAFANGLQEPGDYRPQQSRAFVEKTLGAFLK